MDRFKVKVSKREGDRRPEFLGCDGCQDNCAPASRQSARDAGEVRDDSSRRRISPLTDR